MQHGKVKFGLRMNKNLIHFVANILRKTHLLGFANYLFFARSILLNYKKNKIFKEKHKEFFTPSSHLSFDAYGHVNLGYYYSSGRTHAKAMAKIINKNIEQEEVAICEWGCGPGRVIRYIETFLEDKVVTLYGCDYNVESVRWCQENFKHINFIENNLEPPLSYNSNSFDCLYAISVFTHLSEPMHTAWIKELQRVVKPGGIIIITTHGDLSSLSRLSRDEALLYGTGQIVVRGSVEEGKKWFLAYHPESYVSNVLLYGWDILSHEKLEGAEQDVWVARNCKDKT